VDECKHIPHKLVAVPWYLQRTEPHVEWASWGAGLDNRSGFAADLLAAAAPFICAGIRHGKNATYRSVPLAFE